jgi:hypothetical protein
MLTRFKQQEEDLFVLKLFAFLSNRTGPQLHQRSLEQQVQEGLSVLNWSFGKH